MMRVPLLVAARPGISSGGPRVSVPDGEWHLFTEHAKDTTFRVLRNGVLLPAILTSIKNGYMVSGPCELEIEFDTRGSEQYINVFAER